MQIPTSREDLGAKTPQGLQTREQILEASNQLFAQKGFHATSMRQIAATAGISLGNIYNHFDSKEAIFSSLFFERHPYHEILPVLTQSTEQEVEALVRQAASRMMEALKERPGFMHLMLIELIEFEAQHVPTLVQEVLPDLQRVVERFQGVQLGLRPVPAYVLLRAFIGLFFSYYITDILVVQQMAQVADSQEGALDHFIDIFLHGILQRD